MPTRFAHSYGAPARNPHWDSPGMRRLIFFWSHSNQIPCDVRVTQSLLLTFVCSLKDHSMFTLKADFCVRFNRYNLQHRTEAQHTRRVPAMMFQQQQIIHNESSRSCIIAIYIISSLQQLIYMHLDEPSS